MSSRSEQMLGKKGRRMNDSFVMMPHHVLAHDNFKTLSPRATKFLMDLLAQFRGNNNGDLCATLKTMRERGWNSSDQLHKAKNELIEKDVIIVARQGGLNKANLYAVTWFPIDECKGKLDVAPTRTAPVNWKNRSSSPLVGAKGS
ncbi:MAG: hypothetical protein CL398_10495 [Acidiferrobacteraceae bacterium]|nr:hypothetical protein [Acidiferrobacteraceae bacterium]